jgi:predicted dehydrogenase
MKRRTFVKASGLAAAGTLISTPAWSREKRINIGIVGSGWWARDFLLKPMLKTGQFELAGICDVDPAALRSTLRILEELGAPTPEIFSDYREMYEMKGLQSVVIATPPHWHALQFVDACKKGLDIFLEKPVSWDIREGQAMLKAKQESGIVVQVDFPRIVKGNNQRVREIIESGQVGSIQQVQAQILYQESPLVEKPIPEGFDFNTYCGPAPMQKFLCLEESLSPRWREQFVFSRGIMVDWGIHYLHNVRQVMGLELPVKVSSVGGITSDYERDNPDHLQVHYDFDGLPVYWTQKTWGFQQMHPEYRFGVYYFGEKANLFVADQFIDIIPGGRNGGETERIETERSNSRTFERMFEEFATGIRTRSNEGISNTFEEGLLTTSMVTFGDISYRSSSHLEIADNGFDILENPVAAEHLKRTYRAPLEHPFA